jgi:hypothetical protein
MGEHMKRLVPPDKAVLEGQIGNVVYRQQKDGTMHIDDKVADAFKREGWTEANLGGFARAKGWVCQDCGFHGYFKKCGKCGSENMERGN